MPLLSRMVDPDNDSKSRERGHDLICMSPSDNFRCGLQIIYYWKILLHHQYYNFQFRILESRLMKFSISENLFFFKDGY